MPRVDVSGRVERALREAGVRPGARLAVAVSGGADSMTLLDVLVRLRERWGFRLAAVHVHHGLRGTAADRDAAFVRAAAAARGVPVSVVRLDPGLRAPGQSVQVWAREARYAALEAERRRLRASGILTAHTRSDQAETLLLNLLRGTGPRGLAGIPPIRGRILRPLLAVERTEIETYAARRGLAFREDASNRSEAYTRNRIRRRLLPLLAAEYNPRIVASLADLADLLREDEAALSTRADRAAGRLARRSGAAVSLSAAALRTLEPALARRVLRRLYRQVAGPRHDLARRHLAALLALAAVAGSVRLPGGLSARRVGDRIQLGSSAAEAEELAPAAMALPVGRWLDWPHLPWQVRVRQVASGTRRPQASLRWTAVLDAARLRGPLFLRTWQPGDRFRPAGAPGRKKLQDFFVDAKVPRALRGRLPLLTCDDRIACLVGYRAADEFRWPGAGDACVVELRDAEE